MIPTHWFLILSGILFAIGVCGVLTRKNGITIFMSIELMVNAVNLTFLGFLLSAIAFLVKVSFLLFVFVWIRWTIPRLKYDILMRAGWKVFLPLAFVNIVLVAFFIARRWI